jgi:hypothetical protein
MLPDDFLMDKKQVEDALELWRGIEDENKICLNLYADRIGKKCWTNFTSVLKGNVWLTQWVDMCFLCKEKFFTELGLISDKNFHGSFNKRSSGVGAYVSRKLYKKGLNLYQACESLVTPQENHWSNTQMYAKDDYSDSYHSVPPSKLTRLY